MRKVSATNAQAIVAGTGFDGRADVIRAHVRDGMPVFLEREPTNRHDPEAIKVLVDVPRGPFGIFGTRRVQIGYVKAKAGGSTRAAHGPRHINFSEGFEHVRTDRPRSPACFADAELFEMKKTPNALIGTVDSRPPSANQGGPICLGRLDANAVIPLLAPGAKARVRVLTKEETAAFRRGEPLPEWPDDQD